MTNAKIAASLDQIADLLEFKAANPFRVRAYRTGARTVRDLNEQLSAIVADDTRQLTELPGIGKDLAAKCVELIETGSLKMLDELLEDTPPSVLDMLRVRGLGPKKAAAVYDQLGVKTLPELRAACEQHRVRDLKGFGAKTELAILEGLDFAETTQRRIMWVEAEPIVERLLRHMKECPAGLAMDVAGSFRRRQETVGDLDLLVCTAQPRDDASTVMDCFGQFPDIAKVAARGDTKMSVLLESGLQVDLRVVPRNAYGAALQYFTGSQAHNVELRGRARRRGMKLNEYGLFRLDDDSYVAGQSEADVYRAVDLPKFPPEMREGRQEFAWAEQGTLPELIHVADIQGDLHMHTVASDGKGTITEMVEAARQRGLRYIAITDHSQRVSMAGGLTPKRVLEQWCKIDRLNESLDDSLTVLKGIECDILEKGGMDLPDDVLAQADWVLASVHYGQKQSRQQITDRILGAIQNRYVSAIAHPTGRIINRREAYDVDLDAVMQAASENHTLLELNANPRRLDLHDVHCASAKQWGVPITINTDAHSPQGLDVLKYGIYQARRGCLTADDVINCLPLEKLRTLLAQKRN